MKNLLLLSIFPLLALTACVSIRRVNDNSAATQTSYRIGSTYVTIKPLAVYASRQLGEEIQRLKFASERQLAHLSEPVRNRSMMAEDEFVGILPAQSRLRITRLETLDLAGFGLLLCVYAQDLDGRLNGVVDLTLVSKLGGAGSVGIPDPDPSVLRSVP